MTGYTQFHHLLRELDLNYIFTDDCQYKIVRSPYGMRVQDNVPEVITLEAQTVRNDPEQTRSLVVTALELLQEFSPAET